MHKLIVLIGAVILLAAGILAAMKYSIKPNMLASQNLSQTTQVTQQPSPTRGDELSRVSSSVSQISLVVNSPANGALVLSPNVKVQGKTIPNAQVSIDEIETTADGNGNFSAIVVVDEGDNDIIVVANDDTGNYAEQDIQVTYNSGQ